MERRIVERMAVALLVEYDLGAPAAFGNETLSARAQDICTNGIRLLTSLPLQKGAVLKLNIPVKSLHAWLPVFAEVAWTGAAEDQFLAGLRFLR
jgi:hypothetical protein